MEQPKNMIVILLCSLLFSCSTFSNIDHIHSISELDHYIVQDGNKYAVIDNNKNIVVPFDTIRIIDFSDNIIEYILDNKYYLKNSLTGTTSGSYDQLSYIAESNLFYAERNSKVGYLDKFGVQIIPMIYETTNSTPERPREGFIRIKKDGKYGVIDVSGKEVIPAKYHYIEYKGHDLFTCRLTPEGHSGIINSKNEIVLKLNYAFGESDFSEGKILAYNFDSNNWGAIDTNGNVIIDFKYDYGTRFKYGVLPIKKNNKWGLVDSLNRVIVDPIYSDIKPGINGIDGLFSCYLNKKAGVVNNKGEEVVPFIYRYCSIYHGRIIVTDTNNLCGVLDRNGSEVIACLYDQISFSENIYQATKGSLCYYFSVTGELLTKTAYSKDSREIYDNYALVKKNGKYGIIDTNGAEIVKCHFEYVAAITSNPRKFVLGRKGKFYVADLSGIRKLEY